MIKSQKPLSRLRQRMFFDFFSKDIVRYLSDVDVAQFNSLLLIDYQKAIDFIFFKIPQLPQIIAKKEVYFSHAIHQYQHNQRTLFGEQTIFRVENSDGSFGLKSMLEMHDELGFSTDTLF